MKELAEKMRVTLLFNAPYTPWFNPVETLFAELKRHVSNAKTTLTK
jgi:transposase